MNTCAILILFLILTLLITNGSVLRWFFSPRQNYEESDPPTLRSKFNEHLSRDNRFNREINHEFDQPMPYVSRDIRLNRTVNPEYGQPIPQVQSVQRAVVQQPTAPVLVVPQVQSVQPAVVQQPTAPVQSPVAPTVPVEPVGVSTTQPLASSCNWSEFIDGEPEQELGKQFDLSMAQSACEKETRCEHVSTMKDAKGSDIYVMGYGALKPSTRGMKTSHCTRTKAPAQAQTKTGGRF